MEVRKTSDEDTVHLFREGTVFCKGPEPCLNMGTGNPEVKGREGTAERRRSVPLNDDEIRAIRTKDPLKTLKNSGGKVEEGLLLHHDLQIVPGRKTENGKEGLCHFPMLTGMDNPGKEFPAPLQCKHNGGELHDFWPCSKDKSNANLWQRTSSPWAARSPGGFFQGLRKRGRRGKRAGANRCCS